MKKKNNIEAVLNDLIQLCKDGEKGYRDAAESVTNGYHKMFLSEFSRQRSRFATVLQGYVRANGGDPEKKGSVIGTIHRGWMNLEAAIHRKDDRAVITECERGEEIALKHYRNVNSSGLSLDVQSMLQAQIRHIQQALDKLRAMTA